MERLTVVDTLVRVELFKNRRRVRCVECLKKETVPVSRRHRLRYRRCSCGGRMRPQNWTGFR